MPMLGVETSFYTTTASRTGSGPLNAVESIRLVFWGGDILLITSEHVHPCFHSPLSVFYVYPDIFPCHVTFITDQCNIVLVMTCW